MKSSFYIPLALNLSLCLILGSCQGNDKEQKSSLNANFSVRYLAKGKAAKKEAHLTVEDSLGSNTAILSPSGVSANKMKLSNKWLSDKVNKYQLENIQEFEEKVVFEWSTPEGDNRSDTLSMLPLSDLQLNDTLSTDKPLILDLKNNLLDSTESITLILSEKQSGITKTIAIDGPLVQGNIKIDLIKEGISPGDWRYYFVKRKEEMIQENTIILQTSFEYYSFDAQVLIK